MENNYENAPQEETQSTQPAPQNEESTNSEYSNSNENMNQNYQYSYGNNEYQPNGYDNQNGSNQYNQPDKSVMSMGDWLITLLASFNSLCWNYFIFCMGVWKKRE